MSYQGQIASAKELIDSNGAAWNAIDAEAVTRMVALCKGAGARVLLVGMQIPPNYGPAYTARFAAVFPAVAKAQNVALVPFLLSGVVAHPDWFQSDNIHPTAQAQPTMLQTVWPRLQPLLKQQSTKVTQ